MFCFCFVFLGSGPSEFGFFSFSIYGLSVGFGVSFFPFRVVYFVGFGDFVWVFIFPAR